MALAHAFIPKKYNELAPSMAASLLIYVFCNLCSCESLNRHNMYICTCTAQCVCQALHYKINSIIIIFFLPRGKHDPSGTSRLIKMIKVWNG